MMDSWRGRPVEAAQREGLALYLDHTMDTVDWAWTFFAFTYRISIPFKVELCCRDH
jgi:hypothetical protein